jgi:hypothetical protein
MNSIFLTAEWRYLLLAQYVVDTTLLAPYTPPGLELDLFDLAGRSRCYVSLVGFLFDKVRIKGIAVPLHTRFEEINLRFYVRRTTVSKDAVSSFFESLFPVEPSHTSRRSSTKSHTSRLQPAIASCPPTTTFQFSTTGDLAAVATAFPLQHPPFRCLLLAAGSEEEFITEHYWGYTKCSDGNTSVYQVQHPRWQIYPLQSYEVAADFGMLYGPDFAFLTGRTASSVLLAEGSAVSVLSGERLGI